MQYILLLVLLCSFDVFANHSMNGTTTETVPHKKPLRRRTIAALVFSNTTALPNNRTLACRWLRGYTHQNKQCRKRRGFPDALLQARHLAISNCEEQFRFDRWNCSHKKSVFKKVFRETAFLHAITSSAIMYSVAKACSSGKLQNCRCADHDAAHSKQDWKWGGCGDNTKQAKKITRKFLQLKQLGDGPHNVLSYNSLVGMKLVAESEEKVCKCHGVSASCVMKTCWKSLIPFEKISEKLKRSYHNAIQHTPRNTVEQTILKINQKPNRLLYLASSPNFCHTTAGRRCKDTDNCATLCCGRGFDMKVKLVEKRCKCRWRQCCYDVACDTCTEQEDYFTCK